MGLLTQKQLITKQFLNTENRPDFRISTYVPKYFMYKFILTLT